MSFFSDHCETICGSPALASSEASTKFLMRLWFLAGNFISGKINGKDIRLELGIVDSADFNAWAVTIGDIDMIGINAGVYPILLGAFRGVLCDEKVFPDRHAAKGFKELTASRPSIGDPRSDLSRLAGIAPLSDSVRDMLARDLAEGAMLYILLHEWAHIKNGHTSWINLHGFNYLPERPSPGTFEFKGLQRQTLEYDADMSAVQDILSAVLKPVVNNSVLPSTWDLSEINYFGSFQDCVIYVSAVITISHIFFANLQELVRDDALIFSHPPAIIRRAFNPLQIAHVINLRANYNLSECSKLALESVNKVGSAFFLICDGVEIAQAPHNFTEYMQRYHKLYTEMWAELRPQLDPLKRYGYLAPVQKFNF